MKRKWLILTSFLCWLMVLVCLSNLMFTRAFAQAASSNATVEDLTYRIQLIQNGLEQFHRQDTNIRNDFSHLEARLQQLRGDLASHNEESWNKLTRLEGEFAQMQAESLVRRVAQIERTLTRFRQSMDQQDYLLQDLNNRLQRFEADSVKNSIRLDQLEHQLSVYLERLATPSDSVPQHALLTETISPKLAVPQVNEMDDLPDLSVALSETVPALSSSETLVPHMRTEAVLPFVSPPNVLPIELEQPAILDHAPETLPDLPKRTVQSISVSLEHATPLNTLEPIENQLVFRGNEFEILADAVRLFQQGKRDSAELQFYSLTTAPQVSDSVVGQAYYWLGILYLDSQNYTTAYNAFLYSYEEYPNNDKAAESLFGIAKTLSEQNNITAACAAFHTVQLDYQDRYPALVDRASIELRRLGCPM